jgi:hypothetical protein
VIEPIQWTRDELEADRLAAIGLFRKERTEEPLEDYLEGFDKYQGYVEDLLETTVDLSRLDGAGLEVLSNPHLLEAFRYIAAPPISADDLKVLADATLAKGQLRKKPEDVQRLVQVVRSVLDRRRFSWVVENREPTEAERSAAVMASAALMAASRAQTTRRLLGKEQQEAMVKAALAEIGFKEVPSREIRGESVLGTRKGDIIVRLWDQRLMPIECKVSKSYINSVKRLNNDAAVKASSWKRDFGLRQVVPTAVLSGVYKLHNLQDAQERGLTLIWAHNLKPLTDWITRTKDAPGE